MTSYKNFIHFLLKHRYVENWNRELHENYLPLTFEKLLLKIHPRYAITYCEHYTLPFLSDAVMKKFGIPINHPTHIKLVCKLEKERISLG